MFFTKGIISACLQLAVYGELMLSEVCCGNGLSVYVYEEQGCFDVVEEFSVGDLFFVVFANGKYVVECMAGGKSLVFDGLEVELVKYA